MEFILFFVSVEGVCFLRLTPFLWITLCRFFVSSMKLVVAVILYSIRRSLALREMTYDE